MPIPENITALWAVLYDEVVSLHAYWIAFEQLFGKSQARHDLLYASAGHLFLIIEDALGTDVQLTLAKLSDPAALGRHHNATLRRLFDEVACLGNDPLTQSSQGYLNAFETACQPIRDRRNRLIAHSDLSTVLKDGRRASLPEPTVQEIEAALEPLRDFMNAIERAFCGVETAYEFFISREDGDDLALLLKMAHRYMKLREAGNIPWDDLQESEYSKA
jgi:hypothetical protein